VSAHIVLLITPDGDTYLVRRPDDMESLDFLQQLCEGYIDALPGDGRLELYVNDEGKINGGMPNALATAVWDSLNDGAPSRAGEWIAGNLVVCGKLDDDGEQLGLTVLEMGDYFPDMLAAYSEMTGTPRGECSICGEPITHDGDEDWYHAADARDDGGHCAEVTA
jgi:hypothetical protein